MSDQEEQEVEVLQISALVVQYCPNCTLPAEYCEYSDNFSKCEVWLKQNYPKIHEEALLFQQQRKKKIVQNNEQMEEKKQQVEGEQQVVGEQLVESDQIVEEKKISNVYIQKEKTKIVEEKFILIQTEGRGKKKYITQIKNLEKFDINVKEAAKKLSKKFACSASVTGTDEIEMQGDVALDLVEYLFEQFKIDENDIKIKRKKDEQTQENTNQEQNKNKQQDQKIKKK